MKNVFNGEESRKSESERKEKTTEKIANQPVCLLVYTFHSLSQNRRANKESVEKEETENTTKQRE